MYATVLTQPNKQKLEALICFFNSNFQGVELNYLEVEKQAFTIFNSIKNFRPFLLKNHTKVIVPFPTVRQLLILKELGEKRANWVIAQQEYDIEMKPAKIVRGKGFFRLITRASNKSTNEDSGNTVRIS